MTNSVRQFLLLTFIFVAWSSQSGAQIVTSSIFIPNATYTITSIEPNPLGRTLKITFGSNSTDGFTFDIKDLDESRNQPMIHFIPPIDINWYSSRIEGDNSLFLEGNFSPGQHYRIMLEAQNRLSKHKQYSATLNTFKMPDLPPSIDFAMKMTTIERDSRQMVHINLRNVKEILYESVVIPNVLALYPDQIDPATKSTSISEIEELYNNVWTPLKGVMETRKEFKPFIEDIHTQKHLFFNPSPKNKKVIFSVPLTFRENSRKGATQLIQFSANETNTENGHDGTSSSFRLFRITNLCLAAKASPTGLMVWSTAIGSGEPVGGVDILAADKDFHIFVLGKTDHQGILSVSNLAMRDCIRILPDARTDNVEFDVNRLVGIVGSCTDDWTSLEIKPKTNPNSSDAENSPKELVNNIRIPTRGTIFTERGVYRPGEKIYFKGVVREYRDRATRIPEGVTCTVIITDALDQEIYKRDHHLNEFGTLSDNVSLPGYASLGEYTLKMFLGSLGNRECLETQGYHSDDKRSRFLCGISFQVEEFRPPRHKVEISFREEMRKNRQYVNHEKDEHVLVCKVAGKYLAGGPLKHGQVRWKVQTEPTEYYPQDYSIYTFGYPSGDYSENVIESGESILNESGEVEFRLPLGKDVFAGKMGLKVYATVIDFDGLTATYNETYQKEPQYLVGINKLDNSLHVADTARFRFIVLDSQNQLVPDGEVEVRILDDENYYTLKRNDEGETYTSWQTVWRKEYANRVPIRNGSATIEFQFQEQGGFLLECFYRDADGNESISGIEVGIDGYNREWDWEEREDFKVQKAPIQLLFDTNDYAVGDVMKLRLKSSEPIASCLVTIEREGVLDYYLCEDNDKPIEIPIRDEYRPNFHVSVIGTVPRGEFPTYLGDFDQDAPRIATVSRMLTVRQQKEHLVVAIAPETEKLKSIPGASMPIEVRVTDSQGNGVEAEVALAVVDERVLALTDFQTPELDDLLKYELPLLVETRDGHQEILVQTPFGELRNDPLTGGDGGRSRAEGVGSQIRKDFNPVPYFNPSIRTGADGKASVEISFSDTMTTYRIYAVACDKSSRFDSAEKPCLVNRDFYIEPGIPRFLNRGDEIDFQVAAFNKTDQSGAIVFSITGPPEIELSTPSRSYPTKAHDRSLLPVKGHALAVTESPLMFQAAFGNLQDAVQVALPILSGLPHQRDVLYSNIRGNRTLDYKFPYDVSALTKENLSPRDLSVRLTLSGSPLLRLSGGLRYLLTYPYGCAEQTSSGIIPLAGLRTLIVNGLLPGITLEETDKFLKGGIERLLGMQTDSGGFAYWPGQVESSDEATLYAMTALVLSKQAGFDVDETVLGNGITFLVNKINDSDELRKFRTEHGYMALYILALEEGLSWDIFDSWWNQSPNKYFVLHTDRNGRTVKGWNQSSKNYFVLLAAHQAKLRAKKEIEDRLLEALSAQQKGDESAPEDYDFRPLMLGEAAKLLACTEILCPTKEQMAEDLATKLASGMKSDGRWTSTSDTGWVLYALGKYYMNTKVADRPVQGKVIQSDQPDKEFSLTAQESSVFELDPMSFLKNPKIEIQTDSDAPLLAELALVYPRMDFRRDGISQGISITKQIENTAGSKEIHLGDMLKVTLFLDIQNTNTSRIAIDDPLPAGFAAINSALAIDDDGVANSESEDDYFRYWNPDGYYNLEPTHYELRDDRVLVFRDSLWKGVYCYSYYARAICAGKFRLPATRVQMMYDPDVFAYTAESEVEIKPR